MLLRLACVGLVGLTLTGASAAEAAPCAAGLLTGPAALSSDWSTDRPGLCRQILPADLPPPLPGASNHSDIVPRPEGAWPQVPAGFTAVLFHHHDTPPRLLRTAPNGDIFVAESLAGVIRVMRPSAVCRLGETHVFASGLNRPFGIAFYPPGPAPQFVYVAENDRVVRFPYRDGLMTAEAPPQPVVDLPRGAGQLPGKGHWTRDVMFAADGSTMFVAVGSYSNIQDHGEDESFRANVLAFAPDGSNAQIYASGLRNPVSLAISPYNGTLWTTVNERDDLGDQLVPDFVTGLAPGQFYGWPWFYLGTNPDPRHPGMNAALLPPISLPSVLLQAHSASLGSVFYQDEQFGPDYLGSLFVAAHGSWNRASPTGSKVIRLLFDPAGNAMPYYEDFMTGFVVGKPHKVYGRPVGVTVGRGGSLYVSEDANNTTWCVARSDLIR